ncbi:hypothetical protein [Nocardia lijiangensis]|nr:hypothetical protein [Nocardia lijiangensis]
MPGHGHGMRGTPGLRRFEPRWRPSAPGILDGFQNQVDIPAVLGNTLL